MPIRLIHWLLVVLIAVLWWTAENGQMDNHRLAGYSVLALIIFRLYWGFTGSNTAKFSHFIKTPAVTWQYARRLFQSGTSRSIGHNPLGGYSVMLLLTLLSIQLITGLFAIDVDGWEAGPLNHYISFEAGRLCATWHEYTFNTILAWIVLHVLAIAYYLFWRKQNLIFTMFSGKVKGVKDSGFIPARSHHYFIGLALALITLWLLL